MLYQVAYQGDYGRFVSLERSALWEVGGQYLNEDVPIFLWHYNIKTQHLLATNTIASWALHAYYHGNRISLSFL